MDVSFWSTDTFAEWTEVRFYCKSVIARANFMLWDTNIAYSFTAYTKAELLWNKTSRSNTLVWQKWGNSQKNLSWEEQRKNWCFTRAWQPRGGREIFLSFILILLCILSSCQRNFEFLFSLWFTPLCKPPVLAALETQSQELLHGTVEHFGPSVLASRICWVQWKTPKPKI